MEDRWMDELEAVPSNGRGRRQMAVYEQDQLAPF